MKNLFKFGMYLGVIGGVMLKGKRIFMDEKFKYRKDEFKGIHITTDNFTYESPEAFRKEIEDFIALQQKEDVDLSSVWIKLSIQNIYLAHILNQMGFEIHHSESKFIMFNKWMNINKVNKIPSYTTHYISCAPVLISEDNHLLVQKAGGKWGVPVDSLRIQGMLMQQLVQNMFKQSLVIENYDEQNFKFQDTLLIREITKTQSGHPDLLFALQFKCDKKYDIAKQENKELQWIPLDKLSLFIKDNQDHIHYPLHYLILERVNTLHEQKKLEVANPDTRKFDYYYKIFNSHNTIYPML